MPATVIPTAPFRVSLPKLYARTNTGAVQEWEIQVLGDCYRTRSGQTDGKKTVSLWTRAVPMNAGRSNATTGESQALAEARSKWEKKIDAGYWETVEDIDKSAFTEPMLAKVWEDYASETAYPVACQPKLDGVRCLARADGLWSRGGKRFYPWPHIVEALSPLFKLNPKVVYDGEFYNPEFHDDFNKIVSLVKKTKPTPADIAEAAVKLQLHVYDRICEAGSSFQWRSTRLQSEFQNVFRGNIPSCLVLVQTDIAQGVVELDRFEAAYLARGYEGQMVRVLNSPYEFKRSKFLLKRKRFKDAEFEILAVTEGLGNKAGWAASMSFRMPDGSAFNSNVKGPETLLREYWTHRQELIGKHATVRYFNLTPDGVPRFPYVTAIRDYE